MYIATTVLMLRMQPSYAQDLGTGGIEVRPENSQSDGSTDSTDQ